MRPKSRAAGWMPMVLVLAACGQEPSAAEVRIEKKTEVLKAGEEEAAIHTPAFQGIADPAVLAALHESIASGVRDATGSSPDEWLEEWKTEGGGWLTEIDYEVAFNRHGLLCLVYSVSGVGAYPSTQQAYIVADLETGRRLVAKDLFKPGSLEELAARVDRQRSAAVAKAVEEHEVAQEDLAAEMEPAKQSRFGVENLDTFRLDDKGVTFVYDFGFPHAVEALEPSGEYFLSYEELRPYVNPEGPLARVYR